MNCPCDNCQGISVSNQTAAVQYSLDLNSTTGDLTLLPSGGVVNLVDTIKNFETITSFSNFRIVGNSLEITYVPENGATEIRSVDLTPILTGGGTPTSITVTSSNTVSLALVSNNLTANVIIDPASTGNVSASSSGLRIDRSVDTPLSTTSTNTINFSTSGTDNHVLTGSVKYSSTDSLILSENSSGLLGTVHISSNPSNLLTVDGSNGLLVLATSETPITLNNTNTIHLNGSGTTNHIISADLQIDPASTLPHSISPAGLKLDCCAETPITFNNGNTVVLGGGGVGNHQLGAILNTVSTSSVTLTQNSSGLHADVVYSTQAGNLAHAGTDGGIYVGSISTVAPIANAGPTQSIILPTNSINLAGLATTTVGTIAGTIWDKIYGPSVFSITDRSSLTSSITGLVQGSYKFRLTAVNSLGLVGISDMIVNVNNIADTVYYGTNTTGIVPNAAAVTAGSAEFTDASLDVVVDYTALTLAAPVFCWFAIPALGTPYVKNQYYMDSLNNGAIGGTTNLFGNPTLTLISGNYYNVWITNYLTQFTAATVLKHV